MAMNFQILNLLLPNHGAVMILEEFFASFNRSKTEQETTAQMKIAVNVLLDSFQPPMKVLCRLAGS